ncbi:hypothetical protein [Succinimonas sp.]|uniref:hypothetical protein n=1 Tax=Succinimonas sp. TaxID=1936151 RepID=UPI003868FAFE
MKAIIPVNLTEKLLCPYCSGELSYSISRRELSCSLCGIKLSPEEYEAAAAAKKARRERSSSSFSSAAFSAASKASSSSSDSSSPSSPSPKTKAGEAENRSSGTPDYAPCEHCRLLVGRGVGDLLGECPLCQEKISGAENSPGEAPAGESPPENQGFAAPDLMVPFSHDKEFFIQEFRKRLKSLEFVPDSLLKASIESVRAFYVPVFLYDAEFSGEMTFHGEVITKLSVRPPSFRQEVYEIEAAGSQLYFASPENLTCEFSDDVFRKLEPFDSKGARPWSRVYAAIPDLKIPAITSADYFGRSRLRFRESFELFLTKGEYYTSFTGAKEQVSLTPLKVSYAWLPVWVMEIREGGTETLCYMNGQTGKLEADIPVSKAKILCWLFSGMLLLTGLVGWLAAPYFVPVASAFGLFGMGAICMGFLMLLYSVIAPVRRVFSGRGSGRLAGSLMAGTGLAFIMAAFLATPGYHDRTFMFVLAMLAGGGYAVSQSWGWGRIKKLLAREPGRDPRHEGKLYAVKSDLWYRRRRKIAEKILTV